MMYKTKCPVCGKTMYTYAKNKQGAIHMVYCSKVCETNAKYEKRFIDRKRA